MNSTISYKVKWEIDVEASSPEEAAREALKIQRDKDSEAVAFDVIRQSTGEETFVDLIEDILLTANQIEYIRDTIAKHGIFTIAEVQADTSPTINVLGDNSLLIGEFHNDKCIAFNYVHSTCVGEEVVFYEDLSAEVIEQIYELVKNWKEECLEI